MQNQFKARQISTFSSVHQLAEKRRKNRAENEGFLACLYEGTRRAITLIQVSVFVLVLEFYVRYVLSGGLSCKHPGLVNDTSICFS